MLLEPRKVIHDALEQATIYKTGWGVYTVSAPWEHARLMGEYSVLVLLSHYPLIAAFLSAMTVLGIVSLWRDDRRLLLIIVSFPLFYFAYFSLQHEMVVRNVQIFVPFMALLAAIGMQWLVVNGLTTRSLRMIAAGAIALILLIDLTWIYVAAKSTTVTDERQFLNEAWNWIADHPDTNFTLSPHIAASFAALKGEKNLPPPRPNAREEAFVVYAQERPWWERHPANHRDYATTWFGAGEVNFNYYPSWGGLNRIVVIPVEHLRPRR
jgi:hypothetical protein